MARGRCKATSDLFQHERWFPVETPRELEGALDFNTRVSEAIKQALDEARDHGVNRFEVAERMSRILGTDVSKGMIDAYCSQARETHTISLVRFKAFVRATGCLWLWSVVLEGDGLTLLQGEEALHAQASLLRLQAKALADEARRIEKKAPVEINRRGAKSR